MAVPLTMGSPSYRCVELDADLRLTEALFPAGIVLPMHTHERTVVAVMLEGGFDLAFRTRKYDCGPGTVFIEPAGEDHANRLGRAGARPLVLEVGKETLPAALGHPAASTANRAAVGLARRLQSEMRRFDASSLLAMETLAHELLAAVAGCAERDGDARGRAGWVAAVRDLLHEHLDRPLRVADLAREVGVHRVHLGRVFRARYGESIGSYHRRLRIEWAARELAQRDAALADVALRSGFADQSHFTRFFRRVMGMTPRAYRRGREE